MSKAQNVVLVHGGFVDGSGWEGVYHLLTRDGFAVSIVQNPTLSLHGDVAVTRQVLDRQDGPTILVGHSYGGAGITPARPPHPRPGPLFNPAVAPPPGGAGRTPDSRPPPRAPAPPHPPPAGG